MNHEAGVRPILCHFHIFKNAGTSLDGALAREFGDAFAAFDGPRPNYALTPAEVRAFVEPRPRLRAVSSHQVRFPLPEIPGVSWLPAFLLRHPLDRVASVYRFERQQRTASPGAQAAKQHDLAGYVRWRMSHGRHNAVCDFQTAYLSWHPTLREGAPSLDLALARLAAAPLAGTVERMDESLVCAEAALRPHFPGLDLSYRHLHATRGRKATLDERLAELRAEIGADLCGELEERNARDFALHARADRLVDERLAALPDAARARDDFAARCAARRGAEVA